MTERKKAVSCFGHREIAPIDIVKLKNDLYKTLEQQIANDFEIFLSGGRSEFDDLFASVVRTLKNSYSHIKLILVEPYFSNSLNLNKQYYDIMYDSIIVPDELANVHYKKAITLRNQWMIDNSDLVISYVTRNYGGAYRSIKYAAQKNICVINFGESYLF